jgi:hypothetical protein
MPQAKALQTLILQVCASNVGRDTEFYNIPIFFLVPLGKFRALS